MATRYVEIVYLDGAPMLASIDSRTPNKVNGHGDITELQQRGYVITPLVAMTPERIAALEKVVSYHESMHAFEPETKLLRVMLAAAKGEQHAN